MREALYKLNPEALGALKQRYNIQKIVQSVHNDLSWMTHKKTDLVPFDKYLVGK